MPIKHPKQSDEKRDSFIRAALTGLLANPDNSESWIEHTKLYNSND